MAMVAHATGVMAWLHTEGQAPGKVARPLARTMFWRWHQASATAPAAEPVPAPPAPAKVAAGRPLSAQVEQDQDLPAPEPEAPADAAATAPVRTVDSKTPAPHFWPASALDIRALPLQAPDLAPLNGMAWRTDRPMRLRLSITAQGEVVDVAPLDAEPPPADVLAALEAMFKATPFMPARRQGQDVASLQHIEVGP